MTLTEAVKAWSDAVTDANMYDFRGLESDAAEARQRKEETGRLLDALIAKAEAAERAVQAIVVWMHDSTTKNWEPVMDALQEHADQGRVVRRLEESNKSD